MSQSRLYLPPQDWQSPVLLNTAQRRYLVDVLRLGPGDQIEVFDGQGFVCPASLQRRDQAWTLELGTRSRHHDPRPITRLAVALVKGRKLDTVVRMATEVGMAALQPFTCSRSVSRPASAALVGKVARWQSIAEEAARQSGRATVPEIAPVLSFADLLAAPSSELRLILQPSDQAPLLADCLSEAGEQARLLLIGPEGGFSAAEVAAAETAGVRSVRLGLPILRAETAAVVAAAMACLDRRPRIR